MTNSTISILQNAADLGLNLGIRAGDKLTVQPSERCPRDFVETLRAHKRRLLDLLQLPFCMVHSETLEDTIFFCEGEATKAALVEAGADEWSIYTKDELRVLIAHNRTEPFAPSELRKLHEAKRQFGATINREAEEP
jgi:hypothetical protein